MMRSLRGLIICEDPELRARIQELLLESGEVEPSLVLHRYPERLEAARQIRLSRPEVILLAIERLQPVVEFMKELEGVNEGVQVVGISRLQDPRALTELMRYGIRDCIQAPLNRARFHDAIHRLAYHHREATGLTAGDPLICFLPARGGSGTSTLACNVSYTMSRISKAHVLLADFDTASGLSRFLFKLTPSSSLGEHLENGKTLEVDHWRQCVGVTESLHVVHTGRVNPRNTFTPHQMRVLLEFATTQYTMICADLTGSMETYSLELLRRSRRIILVTTTEIPSLGVARDKVDFLTGLDLISKAGVILTVSPGAPPPHVSQIQQFLRVPVEAVLDFGEKRVRQRLAEGMLLDSSTALGRQIEQFSRDLAARLAGGKARAS
jgi:pilus assembly protein CpaE